MAKFGEHAYDLGAFMNRGVHEIANSLYPESNIPLRDHSGLYGKGESRDVEPHEVEVKEPQRDEPELE